MANILIACEESQAVVCRFRELGHWAFSCDLEPCSGNHPEWHIRGDVLPLLNGFCGFDTMDGKYHFLHGKWDLIIAFPPCTYLTNTGNRWFNVQVYGQKALNRYVMREYASNFFMKFVNADCDRIAIENPIGYMSTAYRKPNQIIQPWFFGDKVGKSTCLWLKGLPLLVPEVIEKPTPEYVEWITCDGKIKRQEKWYYDTRCLKHQDRARAASKTFPGIARAMAVQWSVALENLGGCAPHE